jgi:phosphoribosyl-ATP pyrophosphohydrolase/phosphoribosyl-AMP cyclohydrolase
MLQINELKFNDKGLIPAVVVDADTKEVLMVAWMNRESLQISMDEGKTCFWSRSRQELWRKGETSGALQHIVNIKADCDRDTLRIEVKKDGPACHLGTDSCFTDDLFVSDTLTSFSMEDLMALIASRKIERKEGSYTTYLFDKGIDKMLKKIGEESTEVIIAAKGGDKAETVYEVADLVYHMMVLMIEMSISLDDIKNELKARHVVDKKIKQEKMTP